MSPIFIIFVKTFKDKETWQKCPYCGKSAGWFSSVHIECENNHKKEMYESRGKLMETISKSITDTQDFETMSSEIEKVVNGENKFVEISEIPSFIKVSFSSALGRIKMIKDKL